MIVLYIIIAIIFIIFIYLIWHKRRQDASVTDTAESILRIDSSGKINRQRTKDIAGKRFGIFGNVGRNGCSAIAVYNANQILGIAPSFDEILDGFNRRGMKRPIPAVAGGLLGGSPFYIRKYYQNKGYTVRWKSNKNISKDADAYIILGFYVIGAHYQAGEYKNGKLHVYNPKQRFGSIDELNKINGNFYTRVLEIRKNRGEI